MIAHGRRRAGSTTVLPAPARPRRSALVVALAVCLGACAPYVLRDAPSANQGDRVRFLVLHYTSEDLPTSLRLLTEPSARPVSAHYLVAPPDRRQRTRVYRLVPEHRRAWHAGRSYWDGESALNTASIGIEIVNLSRCDVAVAGGPPPDLDACAFVPFPEAQVEAVIALARAILERHPDIAPWRVLGHGDVAPGRKVDPGPLFPWRRLYEAGVGAWYEDATVARWYAAFEQRPPTIAELQAALAAWGFDVVTSGVADEATRRAVRALQLHFRPARHDGVVDIQTAAILFALLERYRPERLPEARRLAIAPAGGDTAP